MTRQREPETLLYSWNSATEPWARIHIDYAGPFMGHMWLIVIDSYSKWLEVKLQKLTTTDYTISALREVFSCFGVPKIIVSDNGPQFTSNEFNNFCDSNNIKHITSTPYHPKTNGLAERAVRTFKERMTAADDTKDLHLKLQKFLISYRNSPQKSTNKAPSEMMMGRKLKTRLDLLKPDVNCKMDQSTIKQKLHHDKKAKFRTFMDKDQVFVKNPLKKGYVPGVITKKHNDYSYLVEAEGKIQRKHADQLKERLCNHQEEQPSIIPEQQHSFIGEIEDSTLKQRIRNSDSVHIEQIDSKEHQEIQDLTPKHLEILETPNTPKIRRPVRTKKPVVRPYDDYL